MFLKAEHRLGSSWRSIYTMDHRMIYVKKFNRMLKKKKKSSSNDHDWLQVK